MMVEQLPCSLAIAVAAAAAIIGPLLTMVLAAAVTSAGAGESGSNTKDTRKEAKGNRSKNEGPPSVPFYYVPMKQNSQGILSADPPFGDLLKSLDKYRLDTSSFLASLTRQHEVARRSEWIMYGDRGDAPDNPLLAARYRDKIGRVAECLESDYLVLEELMQPFDVTIGLTSSDDEIVEDALDVPDRNACRDEDKNVGEKRYTSMPGRRRGNDDDDGSSYGSAAQIITHIIRDWTQQGQGIRSSLYSWCVDMFDKYHFKDTKQRELPVLVPGSGLGRLAYEISIAGYAVEANDVSIAMVAVANRILNGHVAAHSRKLHPFCSDFLVNEIDSDSRYDSVPFPDLNVSPGERLSCTLGDFMKVYGSSQRKNQYGAIVTCFFIDTATNIYEYLAVISSSLCSGGLWINVGPVQWHRNALVQPSGNELKILIEGFGFEILTWSLDKEGVNYRHDEDHKSRYTKTEAYLPIRFVARKRSDRGDRRQDIVHVIQELREMTAADQRISTAYASSIAEEKTEADKINDENDLGGGFVFVEQKAEGDVGVTIEELS